VIDVIVRADEQVDRVDPYPPQSRGNRIPDTACIDEDAPPARRRDQRRVALANVEMREVQRVAARRILRLQPGSAGQEKKQLRFQRALEFM
jgi:hypothetical protein